MDPAKTPTQLRLTHDLLERADAKGFPRLGLDDPSRHGFCPSYQAEGWTERLGVLATRPP